MSPTLRHRLAPLALAALLAAPLLVLASRVASELGVDQAYDVKYVPDGRSLTLLPPGARLSLANAYWLATVQYIGSQHLSRGAYERLYPLIDLVTELDPGHGYAYQTGGIVLSTAGRLEESDAILKKGMEPGRPGWWSYPFYLGFNDYFYRGDYASAARWARIAARTPGASANISHLALSLEVKRGDPAGGLEFLEELLASTADPRLREALEDQVRLAKLQVDFKQLDEAVARFFERHGRNPTKLEDLVTGGLLSALPDEPFGGRYELHADGTVHSTGRDFRFKPPEPGRLAVPPRGAPTPGPWSPTPTAGWRWSPPDFQERRP